MASISYSIISSWVISNGELAYRNTLTHDGVLYVSSGGTANETTVNDWGSLYVCSGGTANETTVNRGNLHVESGGTANETTVNSGGSLNVSSGGTATGIIVSDGGELDITVAPDTYIQGTSDGSAFLMENAVISGYTVRGYLYVESGGTANETTVNYGEELVVSSGGTANETTLNRGNLHVGSGGTANETTVNFYGCLGVVSGGTAYETTVNSGGRLYVYSGGTALQIKENGGNVSVEDGADVTFVSNSFSGLVLRRSATVHSGTTANKTTVNYDGELYVSSGGTANETMVISRGYLYVCSGGTANETTVNSSGYLYVSSGGTANETTVNSGGELYVSSGGTASIAFNPWRQGTVHSDAGAMVEYLDRDANIYYRNMETGRGSKYDIVTSLTMGYDDAAIIYSGGTANSTTVNSGGDLYVSSDGTANETMINGGRLYVESGGTANSTTVNSGGGRMKVSSDGTANSTTVNSGGRLYVSSGGTALQIKENGGYVGVEDGADVTFVSNSFSGLVLNYYRSATVHSGTTANSTTVNSGGSLNVSSNGTICGLQIASGAYVFMGAGAIVDFDLKKRTAADPAMITNLDLITGTPDYTISVSSTQESGLYKLADGVTTFASAITITTTGGASDTLTVGSSVEFEDQTYTLNLSNNELTLSVLGTGSDTVPPEPPVASADITTITNQNVTVSAVFSDDTAIREYSLNGTDWSEYTEPITLSENGTVSFRGTDEAGNISDVTAYRVTNIDKVAPDAPTASADVTTPTNKDVTVTAVFSEDSAVKEYSLNGFDWIVYTNPITLSANGTVSFRGTDAAGNISDVTAYRVTNIDKVAPIKPTASANITAPTNQNVTVTAAFSDDSTVKQYSLNGLVWNGYTDPIVMTENGTVYFRGTDEAGNISEVASYTVSNIDKVAPEAPTASADVTTPTNKDVTVTAVFSDDSTVKQYSLNGLDWNGYTDPIVMTENGTVYFRGIDAAGNISENISYAVTNIQKTTPDPVNPDPVNPDPVPVLDAPNGLSASVNKYNAALSWNKVTPEKGVKVSYEIWIDGRTVKSTSNKYTLKNAAVGTHSFKVRTVFSNGKTSGWSDIVSKEVKDITAPKAGALTVTQTGKDSVTLSWTPATDNSGNIDKYIVTCGNEGPVEVDGNAHSYVFSGVSGKLNATLIAYDAAGNASKTVKKTITLKDVTPPTKVTGLYANEVNNKSGGVLTWNPAADNVGVTQYLVTVEDKNGKKTSYTSKTNSLKLKKLNAGNYKFTVVAVDKAKNRSETSDIGGIEVKDEIDPKIKKLSAKVNKDNSATVTWNAMDETKFGSVKLTLDNEDPQMFSAASGTLSLQNLSAGSHTMLMTAYDAAGNFVEKSISFKVKGTLAAKG